MQVSIKPQDIVLRLKRAALSAFFMFVILPPSVKKSGNQCHLGE
jgi:hypothetical protein